LRDLAEMLLRGFEFTHEAVREWEERRRYSSITATIDVPLVIALTDKLRRRSVTRLSKAEMEHAFSWRTKT